VQNKSKSIVDLAVIFLLMVIFVSCGVNVATPTGRIKSIVESYFKGNGKTMYFIKPIVLTHNDDYLTVDFTFTVPDSLNEVKSNFSIYSFHTQKPVDSLVLHSHGLGAKGKSVVMMFKDYSKKRKQVRYTYSCSQDQLRSLLQEPEFSISIYQEGEGREFSMPGRRWRKIGKRVILIGAFQDDTLEK